MPINDAHALAPIVTLLVAGILLRLILGKPFRRHGQALARQTL
jgi:hypothetical protein